MDPLLALVFTQGYGKELGNVGLCYIQFSMKHIRYTKETILELFSLLCSNRLEL
jgi:hypothetical protein